MSEITARPVELTARHQVMLRLYMLGYQRKHVADHLHLSAHTVHNIERDLFDRLGANNKTQAVAVALSLRLVSLPSWSEMEQHRCQRSASSTGQPGQPWSAALFAGAVGGAR